MSTYSGTLIKDLFAQTERVAGCDMIPQYQGIRSSAEQDELEMETFVLKRARQAPDVFLANSMTWLASRVMEPGDPSAWWEMRAAQRRFEKREICPECAAGFHRQCIEQGCYCECTVVEVPPEVECPHGLVRSMCEQCEQEEQ